MVLYPGHPLVGHIVSVVRRYGQRERGRWIIELPDGSRQYIPISWCSPLSSSEGTLSMPGSSEDGSPPEGADPSPLSLEALRNLAALVRRLQEEAAQRGEEQQDAGRATGEDPEQGPESGSREQSGDSEQDARPAGLGELPGSGSAPGGAHDPASGTPPGGDSADEPPPEPVKQP
jgi:hypothetical protein